VDTANWQPIAAQDLRIGHYVRIGDRWFDHPFLKSQFQISSAAELAAIHAAALTRIHVDLARSTLVPDEAPDAPMASPAVAQPAGSLPESGGEPPQIPVLRAAAPAEIAAARPATRPVVIPRPDPRALRDNLQQSR
jgi:hypothetical protein